MINFDLVEFYYLHYIDICYYVETKGRFLSFERQLPNAPIPKVSGLKFKSYGRGYLVLYIFEHIQNNPDRTFYDFLSL